MTSSITAGASAGSREIGSAVQKFAAVSTVVVVSTGRELSVKGIIGLFGAAVVASLYVSAFAQAPPPGSYQYSCRDIRMRGTTLTAVCSRANGSEQLTALNVARCVGDIGNADGQLICNGGQPAEPVADRCGDVDVWKLTSHIYVSPKGTDSDSCGASPSSPCGSIQRGIDRCGAKGCGVLVRYGLYSLTEPIRLRQGVSVYGRCVFDGDSDRKYRSVIEAPPDGKPGITADKIHLRTVLDGVFVRGSDATSPGGASIAMTVSNSIFRNSGPVGLAIAHTILSSGWGANGAPGQTSPGNSGEGGAYGGGPGGGGRACPSSSSPLPGRGGDGGPGTWNYSKGCFVYCDCSNNNDPKGHAGQDSGQVKGGDGGGAGGPGKGCRADNKGPEDGGQGDPGNPGSCGKVGGTTTADIWGTFPGTDWRPGLGDSGMAGSTGSGGGGGGGGGAYVYMTRDSHWHDVNGMPGGGAGGGGCGGPGGQGGQQGGASFPIVIYSSTFKDSGLTDGYLTLVPGPGGQGGAGAIGGQGGPGGSGGNGGSGHYDSFGGPGSGGPGGAGGQGGAGSGGAGGNGGPSVGIALFGGSNGDADYHGIYASQPGTGGAGGAGGKNDPKQCHGAKGSDGLAGGTGSIHNWY